jgi:hypothetical protein
MLTSTMRTQLQEWLCEGHETSDIIAQARHTWPGVPEDTIRQALPSCAQASPIDALSLLDTISQKRLAEIDRLEQRLLDKECPMAVHTLYRGLLRDTEAQCYKLLTLARPVPAKKTPSEKPAAEKTAPNRLAIKEAAVEKPVAPPATARRLVSIASLIVFAILSLLSCAAQVRAHAVQGSNSTTETQRNKKHTAEIEVSPRSCLSLWFNSTEAVAAILPTPAPHAIVPDTCSEGYFARCGSSSSSSP